MALPSRYTGAAFSRSRGLIDAIEKQLKTISLKPAKSITFSYNPFQDASSIRAASQFLYRDEVRKTNSKCLFKTSVHNLIEEPLLTVTLDSGTSVVFKTTNLTELEILQKFNDLISIMVEPKE